MLHTAGAIGCVVIAGVLVSFVVDDWNAVPAWVNGLALLTTVVLLVSAVRVYLAGMRRKREATGPRTKIVLSDVSSRSRGHDLAERD